MNPDAIIMLIVSVAVLWGGLGAAAWHLRRSTAYQEDEG